MGSAADEVFELAASLDGLRGVLLRKFEEVRSGFLFDAVGIGALGIAKFRAIEAFPRLARAYASAAVGHRRRHVAAVDGGVACRAGFASYKFGGGGGE